jgi:glycolate oxidase FAD binding subunit
LAIQTDLLKQLVKILSPDLVKSDQAILDQYAVDQLTPMAVLFPTDVDQMAGLVGFANRENLAVLPWGSGSKIATGHPLDRLDLVVCTSRLNHIIDVDPENLTITVEAGVKYRDIQARLATEDDRCYLPLVDLETMGDEVICSARSHRGCFLPMDPPWSDRATIGGILAGNSSGPRRLLYGLPRDIVLGVRFVTPDGEIVGVGGKTVKNVSGYDISKLMIGSMGTLGILCEMTLRLLPLPERMETLLTAFGSLSNAAEFVNSILETQLLPAAIEVMNDRAYETLALADRPLLDSSDYVVAVALEAFEEPVARMLRDLDGMAERSGAKLITRIQEREHRRFWLAVGNLNPFGFDSYSTSMAVKLNYPISKWHAVTASSIEVLTSSGIPHTVLTHAGSGLSLINMIFMNPLDDSWNKKVLQVTDALLRICRKEEGSLIFHKTPNGLKEKLPIWGEPGPDWPIMRRIKERMDPTRMMSPGRFIDGL